MARKIKEEHKIFAQELKVEPIADEKIIKQIRNYKLITPLFGGGAKPKEADEVKIIRETEIRGQLRFWWRATRGGKFDSIEKMKEAEDSIFGSSSGKNGNSSKIQVVVKTWSKNGTDKPFEVIDGKYQPKSAPRKNSIVPAYSAFPLQPKSDENLYVGMETDCVTIGVKFSVEFTFPNDFRDEIEKTLFVWENFGGIGARTRRGFGAICRIGDNDLPMQDLKDFQEEVDKIIQASDSNTLLDNQFPLVQNSTFKAISKSTIDIWKQKIDKEDSDKFFQKDWNKKKQFTSKFNRLNESELVWHYLISKLKEFRQYRRDKETGELSDFGKSQWSEPEALRYRMNKRNFNPAIDKFPRAEFGLPILFHMPQKYDKFDATLLGKGENADSKNIERLSSPLILRPVLCSNGVLGIAIILNTPRTPPSGLTLTGVKKENDVSFQLTKQEAETLTESGLTVLKEETDVLKAFLETI